jgi:hypothetical protein
MGKEMTRRYTWHMTHTCVYKGFRNMFTRIFPRGKKPVVKCLVCGAKFHAMKILTPKWYYSAGYEKRK